MVRERTTARPARPLKRKVQRSAKPTSSIWDTPRLKKILSEPVGTPMHLTKAEARAIVREHRENPGPYDKAKADKDRRELRKIRLMWGSV